MNHAAVATPHPLAAKTACDILEAGGNAVDAAVGSMITLCVVLPGMVGLGGYGGTMVLHSARRGKPVAIDFDSRCPLEYRDELFAEDAAKKADLGYLAVTVPANVAGMDFALREFGTQSWKQVSRHALELAADGFPMEAETRRQLEKWQAIADPVSRRAFFPDGSIPPVGQTWKQSDLAGMLRALNDDGPESFYRGEIAERIVKQVREHGGILSDEDFASYRPTLGEPLSASYRGYELLTPPPPAGGISMLQLMKVLEQFDLTKLPKWSAPYLHLVAEASKLCWQDRHRVLGDPDFVTMPFEELLSEANAAAKAEQLRKQLPRRGALVRDGAAHTSNVSIIDREATIVSLTATQGMQFGSRVVIDGLGLVLGHGMGRFNFSRPDHPNRPQPGKRMHHNMSPTIVMKSGKPFAAVGLPGGTKIITVTAQLLVNLIDFHCTPKETVHAPRVHTDGDEPIAVSGSLPQAVVDELVAMGHQVVRGQSIGGPPNEVAGPANSVTTKPDGSVDAASSAAADAACVI